MVNTKQNFLSILSSKKPEEITELIFENSKIKPVRNVVMRISKPNSSNKNLYRNEKEKI